MRPSFDHLLKHYVRTALRSLRRRPGYTVLNLAGLSVGVACCLLVGVYVAGEHAYDRFHAHADRIYRVALDETVRGETTPKAVTPPALAPLLQTDFPEVRTAVRFGPATLFLQRGDRRFLERRVSRVDAAVFEVFSFPLVAGDPRTALEAPYSLVLTEQTARKYFGDEDPLGQVLLADGGVPYTVTGVAADVPAASSVTFDVLVSFSTMAAADPVEWEAVYDEPWVYTYALLDAPGSAVAVAARLPAFVARRLDAGLRAREATGALALEPLTGLYLDSGRRYPHGLTGSRERVYLFGFVAVFILAVAGINFVNLATARSAERAREVALRKVVGARQGQVVLQFVCEAVVLAAAAVVVGAGLAEAALPAFRQLVEQPALPRLLDRPVLLALLPVFALVIGCLAGGYPSLVLARFRPLVVLRGAFRTSRGGRLLREGLVLFQFAVAIVLIAATAVVFNQLDYVRRFDLGFDRGFDREAVLVVHFAGDEHVWRRYEAVKETFLRHPAVIAATASSDVPSRSRRPAPTGLENAEGVLQEISAIPYLVDHDFAAAYGLRLAAGRTFARDRGTDDAGAMLVNEAAARAAGYAQPGQIVGRRFAVWGREGRVVGVVRDFHFRSLHEAVAPLWMRVAPEDFRFLSLRLQTDDLPRTIAALGAIWKDASAGLPFEYTFLDERLDDQYRAEERFGRLFSVFAALAVGLACFGLFGLSAFAAAQRTREVGVRRVLGATVPGLLLLLSKDFVRPVAVAFVVATPVAYVAMDAWLADFAYRTLPGAGTFLLAGVVVLGITLLTVGYHAIRTATTAPVESLRHE